MSKTFQIAVMPGDGIGPEVLAGALSVLKATTARFGVQFHFDTIQAGAKHYLETGTALCDASFDRAAKADAILFGAMGWPDIRYPDGTEVAPQLDLRSRFDLYAGVRPIRAIPGTPSVLSDHRAKDIDLVILRESTEGLFASRGAGVLIGDSEVHDKMVVSRVATERLANFAFGIAKQRRRKRATSGRVTLVDKANVFLSMAFMRKVFSEVASQHSDVAFDCQYVDAMALDLVRRPWDFDILPMENMFGDILSDLAAGLVGGMGFSPSADIGENHGLFQPSHGSAPDIAGKGLANPTAAILSAGMMLEWLGERAGAPRAVDAANAITRAVDIAFGEGRVCSHDIGGTDTTNKVASCIARLISDGDADPT